MKAKDIKEGEAYVMKVSGQLQVVRVDSIREHYAPRGGKLSTVYHCTNVRTKRQCMARSPQKFREKVALRTELDLPGDRPLSLNELA